MNEVIRYYDSLAEHYDQSRFHNSYGQFIHARKTALLSAILERGRYVEVLDLACGTGRLLHFARYGADLSERMVEIAKRAHPEKEIRVSDADDLPFGDDTLDLVFSFHLFMHLDEAKMETILRECHRVLKPGGRLVFDFPSRKRRTLLNQNPGGWHGAYARSVADVTERTKGLFQIENSYGLLFLPVHRFPAPVRRALILPDRLLSRSFLKEYSSCLVLELAKK